MILEFSSAPELVQAAREARERVVDAYTPFPVDELAELIPACPGRLSRLVFVGALLGALTAFLGQTYAAVLHYPYLVGGTPLFAWPAFLAVTFELGVLGGAAAAFFGCLWACRLPRLHHPIFEHPGFTTERFYLEVRE